MNTKKAAYLLPALSGISWGTAGLFVRPLSAWGMNSVTILESRAWIGALALGIFLFIKDRSLLKIRFKDLWTIAAASLIGTLGLNICYNCSINSLTLSLAAVLLGLAPFFVVLLAAPLFKEKITLKKALCTAAAFFGCVLVSGVLESGSGLSWTPAGILIGVVSGFFYALYSIFSRMAMNRGCHALTVTFYCFTIVTIVLLPFTSWGLIGSFAAAAPLKNGLFMLANALCIAILPYVLFNTGLRYMETGIASVLASTEPVAAMVFGIIAYSEIPSLLSLTGMAVVLVSLGIISLGDSKKSGQEG